MKKLILASLATLALPASAMAEVVWRGDFETGDLTQWSKTQMVSPDRLQVVTSPTREGNFALRTHVKRGDDPISSSGNRNELVLITDEPEGSEYYYGWSTMFAEDFPSEPTWQLFAQWHHRGSSGSPPVEFLVNGEEMRLRVGGSGGEIPWRAPLVRGQWHDFVFHVKWSSDPDEGFVEVFHNGELVLPRTPAVTQFRGQTNYLKLGLYRNDTIKGDGVVFHDRFIMGTTLEDVWIDPVGTAAATPFEVPAAEPEQAAEAVPDAETAPAEPPNPSFLQKMFPAMDSAAVEQAKQNVPGWLPPQF